MGEEANQVSQPESGSVNSESLISTNETETQSESNWFYADGVPGTGEKPEFFNDKTFKNLSEQAKSYGELRKKLGEAPDQYNLNVPEKYKDMEISEEDPLLSEFAGIAKEMNMSQDKFDKVVGLFLSNSAESSELMAKQAEEAAAEYRIEQLKEIGTDAEHQINQMNNFIGANFSEETANAIKESITDAKSFKAFNEVINKLNNRKITAQAPQESKTMSREDLVLYMADPRWQNDHNYRNKGLQMQKELYG